MTLLVIAALLLVILGYLAQTTGLCMVRGVEEAIAGKPGFLLSILLSGTLGWVSLLAAGLFDLQNPFVARVFNAWIIPGGLLFGAGAALNNGCGVSTMSKLARGQVVMAITVGGWLFGWWLTNWLPLPANQTAIYLPVEQHLPALIFVTACVGLFLVRFSAEERGKWYAMMLIGLVAGFVFLIEPKWTPSSLLRDLNATGGNPSAQDWPGAGRFVLFVALIGGMVSAAIYTRSFILKIPSLLVFFRHLVAGTLMGAGAAMAGGGNDAQLLLALPSLSLAGLVAVASIVLGIYLVRKLVP